MRRIVISLTAGFAGAGMPSMALAASPQNALPSLSLTSSGTDGSQGQSLLAQAAVPAARDATPPYDPTGATGCECAALFR